MINWDKVIKQNEEQLRMHKRVKRESVEAQWNQWVDAHDAEMLRLETELNKTLNGVYNEQK